MKVGALSVLIDISLKVFRGSTIQNGLYSSPQKPRGIEGNGLRHTNSPISSSNELPLLSNTATSIAKQTFLFLRIK